MDFNQIISGVLLYEKRHQQFSELSGLEMVQAKAMNEAFQNQMFHVAFTAQLVQPNQNTTPNC